MASKYLGTLDGWSFYIATVNGEYADPAAVRMLQEARYDLITKGRTRKNGDHQDVDIFCTAIHLDHESRREISRFDELATTYHVFALGNGDGTEKGELGAACAYAFESQERIGRGDNRTIGLPHENRIIDGYPPGFDLEEFRETYRHGGELITSEQSMELLRYFKPPEHWGEFAPSFGLFKAGFTEFIMKKRKDGGVPRTKWFFCSSLRYHKGIYSPLGAMLIPLLLEGKDGDDASPPPKEFETMPDDHTEDSGGCFYRGKEVSYRHPVIISRKPNERETGRWFDYLSQLIDFDRAWEIAKTDPSMVEHPQISSTAWMAIGEGAYLELHPDKEKDIDLSMEFLGTLPSYGWEDLPPRSLGDKSTKGSEIPKKAPRSGR